MELTKDMRVEVRTTEEGFEGAWFEGDILGVTAYGQHCADGQHWKIRYDGFETEDKRPLDVELCLHSEHVQVRPVDGRLKIQLPQHFSAGYAVEASRNGGWWCGVIANLRTDVKEESWFVYFPDTDTVESYRRSELRPAQEWNGANWELAPEVLFLTYVR